MRGKCTPEIWLTFKENLLRAQEHLHTQPFYRKSENFDGIPAKQSKELLNELVCTKHRRSETRTAIHLSVLHAFSEKIRKVKAQLELNLAKDVARRDSTSMAVAKESLEMCFH